MRLSALPDASRRVIEVLAVASQPLTTDVVAEIVELDGADAEIFVPLRELLFIRSRFTGYIEEPETYHKFVRRAMLEALDPATRRLLHRQIADVLGTRRIADPATIAVHRAASRAV